MNENINVNDLIDQKEISSCISKDTESKSLIDDLNTIIDRSKIPKRKMNFKQYMYKKRIQYGKLCNMGIVDDSLRYLGVNFDISSSKIHGDNNNFNVVQNKLKNNSNASCYDDAFLQSLYYCSDLDFTPRESRREAQLKKMLTEKLNILIEIKKLKEKKIKENPNNN